MNKNIDVVNLINRNVEQYMVYIQQQYESNGWINTLEQENEMDQNVNVFEYCILEYNDEGSVQNIIGPRLIYVETETGINLREKAVYEIGQIQESTAYESEVLLRSFC